MTRTHHQHPVLLKKENGTLTEGDPNCKKYANVQSLSKKCHVRVKQHVAGKCICLAHAPRVTRSHSPYKKNEKKEKGCT